MLLTGWFPASVHALQVFTPSVRGGIHFCFRIWRTKSRVSRMLSLYHGLYLQTFRLFLFFRQDFRYSQSWPWIHYVDQISLEFKIFLLSALNAGITSMYLACYKCLSFFPSNTKDWTQGLGRLRQVFCRWATYLALEWGSLAPRLQLSTFRLRNNPGSKNVLSESRWEIRTSPLGRGEWVMTT